ncbi:hypothetical protein LguiA_017446 [Lonicera macranthoides]
MDDHEINDKFDGVYFGNLNWPNWIMMDHFNIINPGKHLTTLMFLVYHLFSFQFSSYLFSRSDTEYIPFWYVDADF